MSWLLIIANTLCLFCICLCAFAWNRSLISRKAAKNANALIYSNLFL